MTRRSGFVALAAALGLVALAGAGASARAELPPYMEAKPRDLPVYTLAGQDDWLVGSVKSVLPAKGETFLEIGWRHDLGYNEMIAANRNSDPWIPKADEPLVIPTRWLVPDAALKRLFFLQQPCATDQLDAALSHEVIGVKRDVSGH